MKWETSDMVPPASLEPNKVYDATVIAAEERVSQKGNPYISLKLSVYVTPDKPVTQYTQVMVAFPPKLKAFCLSAGLYRQLASQELHYSDCGNKSCRVIIGSKKNDKGYYEIESFEIPVDAETQYAAAKKELAESGGATTEVPF